MDLILDSLTSAQIDKLAKLGYEAAIERKIKELNKRDLKPEDLKISKNLNEILVGRGNPDAIARKIEGFSHKAWGYTQDLVEAKKFIHDMGAKGKTEGIGKALNSGNLKNQEILKYCNDELVDLGDQGAIARKIQGLSHEGYGYTPNLEEATKFIDEIAAKEKTEGIALGLKLIFRSKNLKILKHCNDVLVVLENPDAIARKIEGLSGSIVWCYDENLEKAKEFIGHLVVKGKTEGIATALSSRNLKNQEILRYCNDALVDLGNLEAMTRKSEGLRDGSTGYTKDIGRETKHNDDLVAMGNPNALVRKFWGLRTGDFGYDADLKAFKDFKKMLISKEHTEAIETIIKQIAELSPAYELNEAKELNDQLVDQGNENAIERQIYGFAHGKHGYPKEPEKAVALNDKRENQGNSKAIGRKTWGLNCGCWGYTKDLETANDHKNKLLKQENTKAIDDLIRLLTNSQLFELDEKGLKEVKTLNDWLLAQENTEATVRTDGIVRKLWGQARGEYGYTKDPNFLTNYINLLAHD